MSGNPEHVSFDVMNDYVDAILDTEAMMLVDKHMAACSQCAMDIQSLRKLIDSTTRLPRSVQPDEDVWAGIKQALNSRKERVLPISGAPQPAVANGGNAQRSWQSPKFLVAAAVVLVVASSAVTTLVLRSANRQEVAVTNPAPDAPATPVAPAVVLPASFKLAEGEYNRAIDELADAVNAQRSRLNPETVRTVDHSLAVIDSAITEARRALVADPNNATLVDLLSASYQRKLDLLRRASELSSRI